MADAPEVPEAKDPFERLVALTIAILAGLRGFWYSSIAVGVVGAALGATAFLPKAGGA